MSEKLDIVFAESVDEVGEARQFALLRTDSNGDILDEWAAVITNNTGLQDIDQLLTKKQEKKYVVVVWQADRVLRDMMRNPFGSRAVVDLYQLAWIVAREGEISSRTLPALCKWCAVDGGKLATATERVGAVRECYVRLMHRLSVGLRVEGVGRELVSEIAGKAAMAFGRLVK